MTPRAVRGLMSAAARRGWHVAGLPAALLADVPSVVRRGGRVGTPSVGQAAALVDCGRLLVSKIVHGRVTVAVGT
jgi:hypothetical protein